MPKKKGNGEGSIFKTNTGYRGQITLGYADNGKLIRRSISGKTAKEVREKMVALQNSIITGTYAAPDETTVPELARLILNDELNLNYIKQGTFFRHSDTLKRLEKNQDIKNTPIQELSYTQIKNFLQSETVMSQSIINKVFHMLQKTLNEAVKRNIILKNPMDEIKKPKSSKDNIKVRALTIDEEKKFLKAITENDVNYSWQMLLSMFTGMRMGEINALKPSDISLNAKTISVDKTLSRDDKGKAFISSSTKTDAGRRIIPISDSVLPITTEIMDYCREKEFLFEEDGKFINTSQVNMQFQRVIKKYEILDPNVKGKVSLHSLRHTYATRCIEAGMQPKVLQYLLGHSDISVTLNTYCDAFENFQKENLAKTDQYFEALGLKYGDNTTKTED